MNKKIGYSIWFIIIALCDFWLIFRGGEPPIKLLEALISAAPLVFVTLIMVSEGATNSKKIEKIQNQTLYLEMQEKYLQELEACAEEMVIITGNPSPIVSLPNNFQATIPGDLEVNQDHAMAGIKQAFIRHMVTRHGKDYLEDPFPTIHINKPGIPNNIQLLKWKRRLANAIIAYIQLYESLLELTERFKEDTGIRNESLFNYENFFVGLLYKELKEAYAKNISGKNLTAENIIVWLQPQIIPEKLG